MTEEKICCPQFDPTPWQDKEITWTDKKFVKGTTTCFMHMPLNMGSMMKKLWSKVEAEQAAPEMIDWIILSDEYSMWKANHYLAVSKEVPGLENTKISGTFLTKVFEGPYKNVKYWYKEMQNLAKRKEVEKNKIYFYYTTCPKCAKKWGKNYVIGFLQIK